MTKHCKQLKISLMSGMKYSLLLLLVISLGACQMGTKSGPTKGIKSSSGIESSSPVWMIQLQKGDQAARRKQWSSAAKFYNKALDLMDNPRMTPQQPSRSQIERVTRLASYAQVLAGPTRSMGDCGTKMRVAVRGVQINKHLYPVEFKYNSTAFTQTGKDSARELAQCLREKQQHGVSGITLIGHTDERGEERYNDGLSLRRAKALRTYLKNAGVKTRSLRTEGRGEREPVEDPPPGISQEELHQLNRRVEIVIN